MTSEQCVAIKNLLFMMDHWSSGGTFEVVMVPREQFSRVYRKLAEEFEDLLPHQ